VAADHVLYTRPDTARASLAAAEARLTLLAAHEGPDGLVDAHLNGPRVLASDAPAHLTLRPGLRDADLSGAGVPSSRGTEVLLVVAGHVADASAMHRLLDELLVLLSTPEAQLAAALRDELARTRPLPPSLESRLPLSPLQAAVGATTALRAEVRGQTFPRARAPRVSVAPTRIYSPEQSARALRRCAERGVSLRATVAALCAVAFARRARDPRVPMYVSPAAPLM
jgi:hypothetical protein